MPIHNALRDAEIVFAGVSTLLRDAKTLNLTFQKSVPQLTLIDIYNEN